MKQLYSYQKDATLHTLKTRVAKIAGDSGSIALDDTIFWPGANGGTGDIGVIESPNGSFKVSSTRIHQGGLVHAGTMTGTMRKGDTVICRIDTKDRPHQIRLHTAAHVIHEAIRTLQPAIACDPKLRIDGMNPSLIYGGSIPVGASGDIERTANGIIARSLPIRTAATYTSETSTMSWYGDKLHDRPAHITVGDGEALVDIDPHVAHTGDIGIIRILSVDNDDGKVAIAYSVERHAPEQAGTTAAEPIAPGEFIARILETKSDIIDTIQTSQQNPSDLRIGIFGPAGTFTKEARTLKDIPKDARKAAGVVLNETKREIEASLVRYEQRFASNNEWIDITAPGKRPETGSIHLVSGAIREITEIFARIGFSRVRHPEVDWDWYAFESLNMPKDHPARDEWETFFIRPPSGSPEGKKGKIVLTPHTSNGQVRELEKGNLPIRMINIARCYRRQIDVSHTPMFHQFEGLYVDTHVSIAHLVGVIDYFVKEFFGPDRKIRLRPFHFQFTEPSFEIDITCGICHGSGITPLKTECRLCKSGWLELGGAGMVHPNVLTNGGVDPATHNGFAFGWGIERTAMMKANTKLGDIRILYENDIRFLSQM